MRYLVNVDLGGPMPAVLAVEAGRRYFGQAVGPLGGTHDVYVTVRPLTTGGPGEWLIDGRGVVDIDILWRENGTTHIYEWDWIPSRRPLFEILADVVQHGVDSPTHGVDCACMDKFIRELRIHVHRATPPYVSTETISDPEARAVLYRSHVDAVSRMGYIFQTLGRTIRWA
jgi:hypothetical protein